ncbi:MAG: DUF1302 domain-containing protein, partial [Nevskiales bacterium]
MKFTQGRKLGLWLAALCLPLPASAIEFDFGLFDQKFTAVLNNTVTFGYSWRMEDQADFLIGKTNLNPDLCSDQFQFCQGLQRTQTFPAERLAAAPGIASVNLDDGNLNYDKGDVTQAPLKINNDLNIQWGDFGFFARGIGIYDYVNYDFEEYHPNRITPENLNQVGITDSPGVANRYSDRVYGPGAVVRNDRDDATAKQAALRYDLLDFNFYGETKLFDRNVIFRVGRQTVNWGESTVAVVNSVNQAQPVNANSLFRLGFGLLEELFVPVGMVRASTNVWGLDIEAYYQFEWEPIEIPTPGTFMSFLDVGSDNLVDNANLTFSGQEDPESKAFLLNSPLAGITPTTATGRVLDEKRASDSGQFGFAVKKYFDDLNNGTELAFYAMNYHSKLPYLSLYSADASCARREGNPQGIDARNTLEFLQACPNLPAAVPQFRDQLLLDATSLFIQRPLAVTDVGATNPAAALTGLLNLLTYNPNEPFSDALPLDSIQLQLEYPEDLQMYGMSFNTTFGDYSFQGEVAYRPNLPLQVALVDLVFAGLGPALTRCHDQSLGCAGTQAATGFDENGNMVIYDNNDHTDANGNNPYPDTVNLLIGSAPGSARSFPNFIIPYRGGTVGENAPNSYIQGWIESDVNQYTLGATRVLGASENWIGADQVILLYELAATHVLDMPKFDRLQIEGPYTAVTHASAGADGTGADGSRQACSTNPSCTVGPDGLRFNPTQQKRDAYADDFAWGYRVVGRISYESVFPGISVQPLFIWQHDISGNSPGPAANFVEGRKTLNLLLETRHDMGLSLTVAYNRFSGAGTNN